MKKIGIISDTHGCFDDLLRGFLNDVDEIWHAGDIGGVEISDRIARFRPLRAVYGNIDGGAVRSAWPRFANFMCEDVNVLMTHIGGRPGHYESAAAEQILRIGPTVFITGHSHILRVGYDKSRGLLHINPGAAGCSGFHHVRTAIRLTINGDKISDLEVGEWPRGR